ncbi:MAG: AAA family ATPase [bacterium]|nr:AAA family ATPase [bacterium]
MTSEFSTELAAAFGPETGPSRPEGRKLDIKRLLRMRGLLMVGVFLTSAIPVCLAAWFLIPLKYEAWANIQFLQKRPEVLGLGDEDYRRNYEQWVQTQVSLMGGNTIQTRVLDLPAVRSLPVLADTRDPLLKLKSMIQARLNPGTELATISVRARDRDVALLIVDETVAKYMNYALGLTTSQDADIVSTLLSEEKQVEQELATLRDRISQRKRLTGVALLADKEAISAETQTYHENLALAKTDLFGMTTDVEQSEEVIANLTALKAQFKETPDEPIYEYGIETTVTSDRSVGVNKDALAAQEVELAQLEDVYQPGAKQLKVAVQARDTAEKSLADAKRKAREEALESLIETYRMQLDTASRQLESAQARVTEFESKLSEGEARAMELSEALADVELMEKDAEGLEARLGRIRTRLRDKSVESNAPANIQIASTAQAGEAPDYGPRQQSMVLAVAACMCLAVGLGIARELTDQQVRTPQDVALATNLPILAVIPDAKLDRLPVKKDGLLVAADHPDSTTADEYRRIITRVIYPPEGSAELNTCLVTGPSRADGKTSVACNLAIALAQASRRVLLVDVGARRADVERLFGYARGPGLSEALSGTADSSHVVRETRYPDLHIVGPGMSTGSLAGRLASRDAIEFFEKAEEAYDHVIIDTPPALLMADAKLLAPVVDGVVLVVGSQVSSLGMVRRCCNEFRQIGANLIGVVLNSVKLTPGGYMRENLDQFYAYSQDDGGGAPAEWSVEPPQAPTRPVDDEDAEDAPSIILVEDGEPDDGSEDR